MLSIVDFTKLCVSLRALFCEDKGRKGYHIESGFAALVLQWMEDLSDRELEHLLQKNNTGKLFCGFSLLEKTDVKLYYKSLKKLVKEAKRYGLKTGLHFSFTKSA